MKKIKFNYSIGDTVTLIKEPSYPNRTLLNYNYSFYEKDYRIRAIKYVIDNDGEKILYQLDAYWDEYLHYHNWMDESCFKGNGKEHIEDIEFISIDNKELNISDNVYSNIYYGSKEDPHISPDFTFTDYGKIIKLMYTWEGVFYADNTIKVSCTKEAVAEAIKYWISEHYDEKYTFYTDTSLKEIDNKFIEDYIKSCKNRKFNPFSTNMHESDKKKVSEWLNFMGIYEDVKKNYKKITVRNKVKVEKDITVEDIVSKLTSKQKKEILKLLSDNP